MVTLALEAILRVDWATRKVLAWRLSNTMEAEFCVEALKDALAKYGPPEIFNSDKGSQSTSDDFPQVLKDAKVKISMDGRSRWPPLIVCKQTTARQWTTT